MAGRGQSETEHRAERQGSGAPVRGQRKGAFVVTENTRTVRNGVVVNKLYALDEVLNELRTLGKITTEQLRLPRGSVVL